MALNTYCTDCGTLYSLKDEFLGKEVRCISCKAVFVVKDSQANQPYDLTSDDDYEDEWHFDSTPKTSKSAFYEDEEPYDDEAYNEPAKHVRPKPKQVVTRKKKGSSIDPAMIVGAVGGVSCLILIGFMIFSSLNGEPSDESTDAGNRNASNVSVLDRDMGSPAPSASTKRMRDLSSQRKLATDIIGSFESMGQDLALIQTRDQVQIGFMALNAKQALMGPSRLNSFGVFNPSVSEMAVLRNELQQRLESAVQKMEREYDRVTQIPGVQMRSPRPDFAKYRSILSTKAVPDSSVKWPSREEYAEIRVRNTPSQEAADKLQARFLGLVDHREFATGKVKFVPGEGSRHSIYPVNNLGAIYVRLNFGKVISMKGRTIQAEISDSALGISNTETAPVSKVSN